MTLSVPFFGRMLGDAALFYMMLCPPVAYFLVERQGCVVFFAECGDAVDESVEFRGTAPGNVALHGRMKVRCEGM